MPEGQRITDRRSLSGSLDITAGSGIWDSEGGATEINVFPDNKIMVYNATLSEYERVMRWQISLEDSENGGNFYRQILPTVY